VTHSFPPLSRSHRNLGARYNRAAGASDRVKGLRGSYGPLTNARRAERALAALSMRLVRHAAELPPNLLRSASSRSPEFPNGVPRGACCSQTTTHVTRCSAPARRRHSIRTLKLRYTTTSYLAGVEISFPRKPWRSGAPTVHRETSPASSEDVQPFPPGGTLFRGSPGRRPSYYTLTIPDGPTPGARRPPVPASRRPVARLQRGRAHDR